MLTSVHFLFHGICNLSVQWRFGTRTFPKCFPESFPRVASEEFNNYCVCGKSLPVLIASRRTRLMLQLAWGSCAPQQGRVIHDWNARGIVRRQRLLDPSGQDTRAVPGSQRPLLSLASSGLFSPAGIQSSSPSKTEVGMTEKAPGVGTDHRGTKKACQAPPFWTKPQ